MRPDLWFLTDFADGAVMFPLGVTMAVVLILLRQRRAALAWATAIGCVWAAILVLKLGGYTLAAAVPGSPLSDVGLVTPSGHVASAAAIYGGLIGLLLSGPGRIVPRTVVAALAVAVLIGVTRVVMREHSLAEVIVGAGVGMAGAAGVALGAGSAVSRRARPPILAVAMLVMVMLHGEHLSWERAIHRVALQAIESWRS